MPQHGGLRGKNGKEARSNQSEIQLSSNNLDDKTYSIVYTSCLQIQFKFSNYFRSGPQNRFSMLSIMFKMDDRTVEKEASMLDFQHKSTQRFFSKVFFKLLVHLSSGKQSSRINFSNSNISSNKHSVSKLAASRLAKQFHKTFSILTVYPNLLALSADSKQQQKEFNWLLSLQLCFAQMYLAFLNTWV